MNEQLRLPTWATALVRHRRWTSLAVTVLLLAGLVGVVRLALPHDGEEAAVPPAAASSSQQVEPPAPRAPTRIEIPSLDVVAPILPIEMNTAGVLTPPADVDTVGWWKRSAKAGARRGQILITGHSVRIGDGAMDHIGTLERGAEIVLRSRGTTTHYRTTEVFTYDRAQVAEHAYDLFGQDRGQGGLVLVTCTDWDGQSYESNIIVRAEPILG
ncbi:MAG: class F sortase [Nocardioides sp.]|nr:class F sortase [Nocardioides sp.]